MMGSSTNRHRPTTTTKLPSQNPSISSDAEDRNPNPNFELNVMETEVTAISPLTIDGAKEDSILQNSKFLTREQVIRRRSLRLKQLEKFYRDHYWALMEDLRVKHREYYWKYGMSPFEEEGETGNGGVNVNGVIEGTGENNNNSRLGFGFGENGSCDGKNTECAFAGCKLKPMALTTYCHSHILSDTKQKLYKACTYIIKSAQTGPVHCGKPILRTTVPSLCTDHYRKAQKHVTQALKMAGLNISSSSKVAPKFHVIVAESVRQINAKRRKCRANIANAVIKEEIVG